MDLEEYNIPKGQDLHIAEKDCSNNKNQKQKLPSNNHSKSCEDLIEEMYNFPLKLRKVNNK